MGDRNCDLLFEYLKSILYDERVKRLDIADLDDSFQQLGLGLQYLEKELEEMKSYSAALSKGNLSVKIPPRDNLLCANLKNMHANLNHLTWQAKQVAKGDYSQKVSFLGEFSEAFNIMTKQLEEREERLKAETELEKAHALEMELVAHLDSLTKIGNRIFFFEKMEELLADDEQFVLCYCDLDHLKIINDNFGHEEGDRYLCRFIKVVKKHIRSEDVFARIGGDEFCVVLKGCAHEIAVNKMQQIQQKFSADFDEPYPMSFSFGIVDIPEKRSEMDINEILKQADKMMYEQKKAHHAARG